MEPFEFIDWPEMAKRNGVSEQRLRAEVLSGNLYCYVFVANTHARGAQDAYLPPWNEEQFPMLRWQDHGSEWSERGEYRSLTEAGGRYLLGGELPFSYPTYHINGWVMLDPEVSQLVLTKRQPVDLHGHWVHALGLGMEESIPLRLRGESVWVAQGDDGYHEIRGPRVDPGDLFFLVSANASPEERALDKRRENNLLRVILALEQIAELPARGAATPIVHQLNLMGLPGPSDETVRKILDDARSVRPKKRQ